MPAARELTVTTGWGEGRKARFVGFAERDGGLVAQHVGPTTTVITLDSFPARVIVVHEDLCRVDLDRQDGMDGFRSTRSKGKVETSVLGTVHRL